MQVASSCLCAWCWSQNGTTLCGGSFRVSRLVSWQIVHVELHIMSCRLPRVRRALQLVLPLYLHPVHDIMRGLLAELHSSQASVT